VKRFACLSVALWLAALLPGPVQATERYSYGVLSQRSAVLTAQYWNPILDYVRRKTDVALILRIARTAQESNEAIERGDYDFVYSNTIFLPRLQPAGYRVVLKPRDEAIAGQIVVLEDSPVRALADLDGREVGFPSPVAFVGYAVPMNELQRRRIDVTPVFGGNQEGIMGQLAAGRVVAAGVNSQVMAAYAARNGLRYRVLWESPRYLNLPVSVHPRVPEAALAAVVAAIDGMHRDPEGLKILEASARTVGQQAPYGFEKSTQEDYRNYVEFYKTTTVDGLR